MEIDDVSMKTSIYSGFSMAMLNNQMVNGGFAVALVDFRRVGSMMWNEFLLRPPALAKV